MKYAIVEHRDADDNEIEAREQAPKKTELFIDNKLRLAITNSCNLSCFYCHNEGQPHGAPHATLSLEYVKNMIKFLQENNVYVESINLTGGEPLMHPDLLGIVAECAKVTDKVRLNTNATLLTEKKIDDLIASGVTSFKIGVDSLFAEQSKPNLKSNPTDIEKIKQLIKYAANKFDNSVYADTKKGVVLNTVVTKHNYQRVDDMIKFAMETGLGRMKILRLNDLDSREKNDDDKLNPDLKTDQPVSSFYFDFYKKYVDKANHYKFHKERGRTDVFIPNGNDEFEIRFCDDVCESKACAVMFTEIDAQGNIMVCPRHHITAPLDFRESFNRVYDVVTGAAKAMCDSRTKQALYLDNFSDLGDIPIDNEKATARGAVARSANPVTLDDEQAQELKEQGYTDVIDIRRPEEVFKKPSRYWQSGLFNYNNYPLMRKKYDIKHESHGHGQHVFERMIEFKDDVADIFRGIANAKGGAIIHCAGGKHRTGTIVSVLLSAMGIKDPNVITDYSVSFVELDNMHPNSQHVSAASHDITSLLDTIRKNYGSVQRFLVDEIGLTEQDMIKLNQKFTQNITKSQTFLSSNSLRGIKQPNQIPDK